MVVLHWLIVVVVYDPDVSYYGTLCKKKEDFAFWYYLLDQKISKWNCGVTYPSPSLEILVDGGLSPSLKKFKTRVKSENRRSSARDAYSVQCTKKSNLRRLTFMRPLHATGNLDLLDWLNLNSDCIGATRISSPMTPFDDPLNVIPRCRGAHPRVVVPSMLTKWGSW